MTENRRRIHIWAIIWLYQPNFSGAAIQAQQIYKRLVQQGYNVTVLTTANRMAHSLSGQQTQIDGVDIRYLPTIQKKDWASLSGVSLSRKILAYGKGLLSTLLFGLQNAQILWREGRANDIVMFHSSNTFSLIPIWMARLMGMHSVVQMTLLHTDDPEAIKTQRDWFLTPMRLEAFWRADAIVGYSSAQIESCLAIGLDSSTLNKIPCGVDLESFSPQCDEERVNLRRCLGLDPEGLFIIFVGDVIVRKGIDIVVSAFLKIQDQIRNAELLIVGPYNLDDPRYAHIYGLRKDLETSGCASRVHWIGRVENVYDYMRASDVFCFPSRLEGFGIVIIEAMAVGLPTVVSRLQGVTTDIISTEKEGILIPGENPTHYADALFRLLKMSEEADAMGKTGRLRVETVFNLEHIVQSYVQLYSKLTQSSRSRN